MDTCEHELVLSAVVGLAVFAVEQLLAYSSCDSNSTSEFLINFVRTKNNQCTSLKADEPVIHCP